MPRPYIESAVTILLQDDASLVTASIPNFVAQAIAQHSSRFPRVVVDSTTSDGNTIQELPTSWIDRESSLEDIEWPVDDNAGELNFLDRRDWTVHYIPGQGVIRIRFKAGPPTNGTSIRFHMKVPHTVTNIDSTLSTREEEAVSHLGASIACSALASKFGQEITPSLSADAVDHGNKTKRYQDQARTFRGQWLEIMGLKAKQGSEDADTEPSGASAQWDLDSSAGIYREGQTFIHHTRWKR